MKKCRICIAVIMVALFAAIAFCESKIEDPYKIKSTYIISFIKYLEWERKDVLPDDRSPIIIGIYSKKNEDSDQYLFLFKQYAALINENAAIQKKLTKNHPLEIKRFVSLEEVTAPCHILFLPSLKTPPEQDKTTGDVLNELKKKLDGYPTLLVGDAEGFAETMGGHIHFVLVKGRIEFIVNLEALKQSGIQVRYSLIENAYNPNKEKKE
ncbi:MAG: YfiR family protein [Candidatus Omnitrophota bacterium]